MNPVACMGMLSVDETNVNKYSARQQNTLVKKQKRDASRPAPWRRRLAYMIKLSKMVKILCAATASFQMTRSTALLPMAADTLGMKLYTRQCVHVVSSAWKMAAIKKHDRRPKKGHSDAKMVIHGAGT